jgi:hypothetical protein
MDVILSTDEVDIQECEILVSGLFEDERPLQGATGWIDWRLNGKLSHFLLERRLTGAWKETTLIPSEGRVIPRMILILGLGRVREYSYLRLRQLSPYLTETLRKMQTSSICLCLPCGIDYPVNCGKSAEVLIAGIADCLGMNEETSGEAWIGNLHLIFPVEKKRFPEILLGVETAKSILENRLDIRIFVPSPTGG